MAAEYVDPFLKQGFDGDRIRCGGCLGGLLILGSVGSAVPLLFVPIWLNVPSSDLIRWKPLPGRPPPTMTATLFRFDFEKPEWTGTTEVVPGFDWLDFCRYNVNDTLPVAKKLIEGTIFQPDPLEADQQVCIGATYACWLTVLGVLTIAGADLFILLSGLLKSILLLLLGGWLALLSAFALLLALAGLSLVDAKHLGTAPGVILLGSSVAFAFVGTTMALYQAMRATPDHLPKERQKWKEDDEELTEEEEKKRVQQILVECLDYDIPRLERYRVSMHILEECAEEEISYEEWLIEERLRMKTGKSRRAVLTEEELHKATVELRVRRRAHPALAQAVNIMVQESRKGRAAGRVPVSVLQEAFQGIDVTLRNRVTTREILAALKVCGIYVEGPAMDDLISWLYKQEEAQGEADTLDLPMFVALFNQVTDMLAKEMILKKAARGYQLTCRMAFLMNLVFLCVVLLSVTQEGADASWNSLLNVFGILFAIQFWSVIALPMLCSVLGKKAKVWRQHFCLQLLRCLSPLIRLCKRLCLCLCEVLLFIKGCCGLCKLCCGTLEDPDEEKGIAEETMSEGSHRGSIETGGRGSIESSRSGSREHGRRGSMEKQNRISGEDSLSMTKASSLPLAIGFATASAMLRSVRGVWQEELVCESLTPMRLVFWNGIWSLLISIPLAAFSEGFKALPQLYMVSFEAKMALLGSTVAGVLLNITQVLAVKELGALMQSIVGNLNLILVIALSQAWLHEEVALFQHFGIILLATGTFVNHVEPKKKAEMEMDQRFREALRIISAASPRSCLTPVGISNDAVASER